MIERNKERKEGKREREREKFESTRMPYQVLNLSILSLSLSLLFPLYAAGQERRQKEEHESFLMRKFSQ